MHKSLSHFTLFQATLFIVLFITFAGTVIAWSGPSATAPNSNVSAPINVGSTNQIKNGSLGVNALAVYGNTQSGKVTFLGNGTNSDISPDYYGIYQEAGAWSSPYPDLHIGFHTGIKYDAYAGYGGHRFYTGYDGTGNPAGLKLQISDNVYVTSGTGLCLGSDCRTSWPAPANYRLLGVGRVIMSGTGGGSVHCKSISYPTCSGTVSLVGNLNYAPGQSGSWRHWAVFFQEISASSASMCMDSGSWSGEVWTEYIGWQAWCLN